MVKLSKKAKETKDMVDRTAEYALKDALDILKKAPRAGFDETVEIAMKLNLEHSSNPIRGTVSLPSGTGKKTTIAVFCKGDNVKKAREAGADHVGGDDLMKKVQDGWLDFDVAVTTPDMMKDLARLGRVLGPRGLMPNPKSGTVTTEIEKTVKELQAGKIEYRMNKQSGINAPVGKISFDVKGLEDNVRAFIKAVMNASPKLQKIQNITSIAVSTTMGPGVKLDRNQFRIA
jgi:large subunit ribosomal protein L1